ncbi:MAG: hypothetical protein IKK18_05990 [Clostridia bacterium]|nr:hypothetical protein [Clostridia bacterium]
MAERTRRTKEEIVAELDKKIQGHKDAIEKIKADAAAKIAHHESILKKWEDKKEAVLNPKPRTYARKKGMKSVMDKAKELGMTPEEVAEKLGISLD